MSHTQKKEDEQFSSKDIIKIQKKLEKQKALEVAELKRDYE